MAISLLAANNAQSVLAAGISVAATTLTVNTGTGGLFPSPVPGTSFFKLTLIDADTGTLTEIVHVTQRVGDQMTIERGQEGTAARIWSANDLVANMMTAGTLSYLKQEIDGKLAKDQNGADIPDKNQFIKNLGFLELTINTLYPVGIVTWFAQNKDPNKLFPGTTWKYIGENRTVRLASANGNDVMTTGGSDSVKLAVGNLPAHGHTFSANTSTYDYGTKVSNIAGDHTHSVSGSAASAGEHSHNLMSDTSNDDGGYAFSLIREGVGVTGARRGKGYLSVNGSGDQLIQSAGTHTHDISGTADNAGAHAHNVAIGAHYHSLSGTTDITGSGAAISIANVYIKLMGWYRSA